MPIYRQAGASYFVKDVKCFLKKGDFIKNEFENLILSSLEIPRDYVIVKEKLT